MEISVTYRVVKDQTAYLEIPESLLNELDEKINSLDFSSEYNLKNYIDDFIWENYEFPYNDIEGFEEIIEMDYDNTLDILAEKYKHLIVPEYPRCIHCGEESLKGNYCSNCGCKLIK